MKKNNTKSDVLKPLDLDLRPGQSIELLKELHILTREGKHNQDSRRKLKQVLHLYQFIEKILKELSAEDAAKPADAQARHWGLTLADHGAGKSYLGFIVYDLFFKALSQGHIYGIETRVELVEASRALAQRLDFKRMVFLNTSVAESSQSDQMPAQIDVV
ncbi:MAG: class I SAM-dependent methyltransferase, partial [Limnohabitans sp.]